MTKSPLSLCLIVALCGVSSGRAWSSQSIGSRDRSRQYLHSPGQEIVRLQSSSNAWNGEVVSNSAGGKISGCSIDAVGQSEPVLEWVVTIDGCELRRDFFSLILCGATRLFSTNTDFYWYVPFVQSGS